MLTFIKKFFQREKPIYVPNANPWQRDLDHIRKMAVSQNWKEIDHQVQHHMVSFTKMLQSDNIRINVYYSTMTVATILTHPVKGRKQLFRKNVPFGMLQKIFINPRMHTGIGYY